jgi:hypothetical protein
MDEIAIQALLVGGTHRHEIRFARYDHLDHKTKPFGMIWTAAEKNDFSLASSPKGHALVFFIKEYPADMLGGKLF